MGRRSKRRVGGAPTAAPAAANATPEPVEPDAGPPDSGPPAPPWGSLPLTEIAVLAGLVMLVAGFLIGGRTGTAVLVVGLLLASLAGFEQALREHRAGWRSHAMVLAALPAAIIVGALALIGVPAGILAPVMIAVTIAAWIPIRADYRRRAEG